MVGDKWDGFLKKREASMDQAKKERIQTGAWGAVGGAIVTMIIGFAWGG